MHNHIQYFHFRDWEDWQSGMYATSVDQTKVALARELLAAPGLFAQVLEDVASEWPVATAQNLSDTTRNHQPWCGRAASCFEHGANRMETNRAWAELTHPQQAAANIVADRFTAEWRALNLAGQKGLPI